jgi:hypothetical protein
VPTVLSVFPSAGVSVGTLRFAHPTRLLERGAPGLHFYTLNQSELTLEICRRLGLVTEPEEKVAGRMP